MGPWGAAAVSVLSLGMACTGPAMAQSFADRWWESEPGHNAPLLQFATTPILNPVTALSTTAKAEAAPSRVFSGRASYYSHSGRVATGARFSRDGFTAAHRTLPFGTRLRVIDTKTGNSVEVTVNDRGPFTRGRVLDLSLGAARALGMTNRGIIHVRAEMIGG
jgi:rare lipoprotein A (peptidoglycan hydrolase)